MKKVSVSVFKKDIHKYAELAENEIVIVCHDDGKAFRIVPVNDVEGQEYNTEFIRRIEQAEQERREGKITKVSGADLEEREIPSTKIRRHGKAKKEDVLTYKEKQKRLQKKRLIEMMQNDEELGLYDS